MTKKKAAKGPPVSPKVPETVDGRRELHYKEFKGRGLSEAESRRLAQAVVDRDKPESRILDQHGQRDSRSIAPLRLSPEEQRKLDAREAKRQADNPPEEELPEPRTLEEVTPAHLRQSLNAELSKVELSGEGRVDPPEEG